MQKAEIRESQNSGADLIRQILREALVRRMDKNPSYSLRAMAKSLGISHAYLSLMLNGRRKLTREKAIEFAELLKLNKRDAHHLIVGSTAPTRAAKQDNFKYKDVDVDLFKAISSWYHLTILDMTDMENFRSEPAWIATRLGLRQQQVVDAIERLLRLKLLSYDKERTLRKTTEKIAFKTTQSHAAIREFHRQVIEKSMAELEKHSPEDFSLRDITGITMTVNPAKIAAAKKKVVRFKREMYELLSQGPRTQVYQMNIQLFSLLTNEERK